ncbi:MAG: HXXEE domain-containing protein [Treponemataceae bacterium]|nr:HXXEE domain-containing protein [Treponemataceae bacterium]
MEEIVGFNFFLKKNKDEIEELFPRLARRYKDFSTEGFAVAVYEELILCVIICFLANFLDYDWLWYIWLGAFLGCDFHFFVHLVQVSIYRKYIPSSITSIICLPINTLIICKCLKAIEAPSLYTVAFICMGMAGVFVNLRLAQKLIGVITRRFYKER